MAKSMRVFVLGAGASADVGYPLTRDLGPKLIEWAASSTPSDHLYWPDRDQLSRVGALDDIEELVSQIEKESKPGPILEGLRNALCEYFDTIRVGEAALYRRLTDDVVEAGDVLVTFNYDVSLDRELRRAGKWHVGDGYGFRLGIESMPSSDVKLLKLHGSTNWMDLLFDGLREGGSQGGGGDSLGPRPVLLPQEFQFLEYVGITDPRFNGGGTTRSGCMILPSRNKKFFVSTTTSPRERERFWSDLWGQAAQALKKAGEIVIIGYSLSKADGDARNLIFENVNRGAALVICCGSRSSEIGQEFLQAGFERDRICADFRRFEDWLAAECCAARGRVAQTSLFDVCDGSANEKDSSLRSE